MALSWPSSIEVRLHRIEIQIQPRRTPFDNHADTTAVGFAEGADPEEITEAASHDYPALVGAYVAVLLSVLNDEGLPGQAELAVRFKPQIWP